MDSSAISIKLFLENPDRVQIEDFVPVFHSWIQNHAIDDHLLIDVANYAHVHDGPGIVLVAHEANYSLDMRGGRMGLTYQRKAQIQGSFQDRLKTVWVATLHAASLLQGDKLKFRRDEVELRICDRLFAPNTVETLNEIKPDLMEVWPGASIEHHPSELELFRVTVKPSQPIRISASFA
jgi:hypothetical protein